MKSPGNSIVAHLPDGSWIEGDAVRRDAELCRWIHRTATDGCHAGETMSAEALTADRLVAVVYDGVFVGWGAARDDGMLWVYVKLGLRNGGVGRAICERLGWPVGRPTPCHYWSRSAEWRRRWGWHRLETGGDR